MLSFFLPISASKIVLLEWIYIRTYIHTYAHAERERERSRVREAESANCENYTQAAAFVVFEKGHKSCYYDCFLFRDFISVMNVLLFLYKVCKALLVSL